MVALVVLVGIHIYLVAKPKADSRTVALARIDIKQPINESEAGSIEKWLSNQEGVGHVELNRQTDIIIFSFSPVKVSADNLALQLKTKFNLKAERFMPSAEQMKNGCPALSHTFSAKAYSIFSNIF